MQLSLVGKGNIKKKVEKPGSTIKEFYEDWIEDDFIEIKELNLENKFYQELREQHQNDWEMVEISREILFLHARIIKGLKERIDDTKERIKGLD